MIHIANKANCCGCSACVQRCPQHCITLHEDTEGFLYPEVNMEACVDCGLCEKVCPWTGRSDALQPLQTLAVRNPKEEERLASSSGGVFVALAHSVIEKGGVVFGAVFDEQWEVKHTYAEKMEGIRPMMGCKYLQSRIGNCYLEAEKFLRQGREVLFTGTPCQIAGLHRFLQKDYPNLLSADFLCHGVPSPGIWRKYLDETLGRNRRKAPLLSKALFPFLKRTPPITGINFRDKRIYGWKNYCFTVYGQSASGSQRKANVVSMIHGKNTFMRGFLYDIYLRPSCYRCKCKNGVSHSDLTLADYWGINELMPDFDDDKGVSLLLLNTRKGLEVFQSLHMEARPSNLDDARQFNGGFKEEIEISSRRETFYQLIGNGWGVINAVEKCLNDPMYKRLIRRMIRKIETIRRHLSI